MSMNKQFKRYGPWAVVTGASEGIGRSGVLELARQGYRIILVARSGAKLQAAAELATKEGSPEVRVITANLAKEDSIPTFMAEIAELDYGLVFHAAGLGTTGPWAESDWAAEENQWALNTGATWRMAHAVTQRWKGRRTGGLVLFGSFYSFQGVPNQAHYAATKAYVQTLAEGLHGDLKPLGIDVLSAAPGPVRTPFLEKAGLASPMGDNVDVVARDILRALGRKATVRPGFWGKIMGLLLGPAPRRLRTAIMGTISRSISVRTEKP